MNERIARRACELFEARGSLHGNDREDCSKRNPNCFGTVPVDVLETETELTICADVRASMKRIWRCASRSLCGHPRQRKKQRRKNDGNLIYSERRGSQIFLVVNLSSDIDPGKVTPRCMGPGNRAE